MRLLVFAHRGEAQAFFNNWEFSPVDFCFPGLFKGKDHYLLLTGEGPKDASEKTVAVCAFLQNEITAVINIGIAGSLNPKIRVGDLYWIRSSYAQNADRCEFKSYVTKTHNNVDCITAYARVTTPEERKKLSSFADIVDRELWPIMSAAHLFRFDAFALKLISDEADSSDICQLVKEEAPSLSKKLLQAFLDFEVKNTQTTMAKPIDPGLQTAEDYLLTHPNLYFTTSQARKLHTLIRGLALKKIMNDEQIKEFASELTLQKVLEKTPKEMSKLLLTLLSEKLNPLNTLIKKKIEESLTPLIETGAQVHYDPEFEQDYIQLNFQIRSTKDQKRLILALEQFNYQKIKDIFNGKLSDDL